MVRKRLRRFVPARLRARPLIDPLPFRSRAVIVLGSVRSGTTKLAEALGPRRTTRLIMEPLSPHRSPVVPPGFVWGDWRDPALDDPELWRLWDRLLRGRVRDPEWLDVFNKSRLPTRRVVKSIEATNLAPWLRARFPEVPIVYVVRDPNASSASVIRLVEQTGHPHWAVYVGRYADALVERLLVDGPLGGRVPGALELWERGLGPFGRAVMRWCLENYLVLTDPPDDPGLLVVRYEEVVADPVAAGARLGAFTGFPTAEGFARFDVPSRSDWLRRDGGTVDARARVAGWREWVSETDLAESAAVLEAFGLASLARA